MEARFEGGLIPHLVGDRQFGTKPREEDPPGPRKGLPPSWSARADTDNLFYIGLM